MHAEILPLLVLHVACGTFWKPMASSAPTTRSVSRTVLITPPHMVISVPNRVGRHRRECCFVHTCEEVPLGIDNHSTFKCYEKPVCGGKCDRNRAGLEWNSLEYNHVPEFRRRNFIDKYICRHGQCVSYKFDCAVCPDPTRKRFNILDLSKDCINCYY